MAGYVRWSLCWLNYDRTQIMSSHYHGGMHDEMFLLFSGISTGISVVLYARVTASANLGFPNENLFGHFIMAYYLLCHT